jgi:hypothetical protein
MDKAGHVANSFIALGRIVALVVGSGAALCCHNVPDPWPLIPDPCCRNAI